MKVKWRTRLILGGRRGNVGSCGCERDGVKGREMRDDSQGVGGREVPFPVMGSTGGEVVGERMAIVQRVLVNCQNWASANLKVMDF